MAQTTFQENISAGFDGQLYKAAALDGIDTAINEGATAVGPNNLVLKGTNRKDAILPAAAFTFQDIAGISFYETNNQKTLRTNVVSYAQFDDFSILKKGEMFVSITGTVTKDQNLFFVHTTGGASAIHTWRGDLDTDKASKTPVIALQAGTSGDVIRIRINTDMQIGVS